MMHCDLAMSSVFMGYENDMECFMGLWEMGHDRL
jgi:hypothetical protein